MTRITYRLVQVLGPKSHLPPMPIAASTRMTYSKWSETAETSSGARHRDHIFKQALPLANRRKRVDTNHVLRQG